MEGGDTLTALLELELEPFTRVIHLSLETKRRVESELPVIQRLYHRAELETFLRGMREAYVYHYNPEYPEELFQLLNKHNLYYAPITRSRYYQGFSHRHLPVRAGDRFFVYGVLARDKHTLEEFVEAERRHEHSTIGRLLGYPECCVKRFSEYWSRGIVDPIYEITNSTEPVVETVFHPACNQALRYFGVRLTPHLPCSPNCEETVLWGMQWYKVMLELDRGVARLLWSYLSLPFTWDCYRGVAIVETPLFIGVTNSTPYASKRTVINKGWTGLPEET